MKFKTKSCFGKPTSSTTLCHHKITSLCNQNSNYKLVKLASWSDWCIWPVSMLLWKAFSNKLLNPNLKKSFCTLRTAYNTTLFHFPNSIWIKNDQYATSWKQLSENKKMTFDFLVWNQIWLFWLLNDQNRLPM